MLVSRDELKHQPGQAEAAEKRVYENAQRA